MPKSIEPRPKGVPASATLVRLTNVGFLKSLNPLLKHHNLRVRTQAFARGGGCPTWMWVEEIPK